MRASTLLSIVLLMGLGHGHSAAAQEPIELKWAQLIPAQAPPPPTATRNPFDLGALQRPHEGGQSQPPVREGRWMSGPRRQPMGAAPVVTDFDGKRVRMAGYVVPLDFNAKSVTEFLLVPFVGACIHVPPPPANQIVYVKVDKGFELGGLFDPVDVTGQMQTQVMVTGLADTGYTITAESVQWHKF